MVSHMSAVQVALLFNPFLYIFAPKETVSLISWPFNQENEDLFPRGNNLAGNVVAWCHRIQTDRRSDR